MKTKLLKSSSFLLPLALSTLSSQAKLIAYWPFDDGEGSTVVTDVVGGFDGTISGGGLWTEEAKVGTWAFSGTANEEVVCDPAAVPATEDLTLSWWMIDNQSSYGTIMNKTPDIGVFDQTRGFVILVRPSTEDSPIRFRLGGWQNYGGWGTECRVPSGAYADGEWVHVTCVYDSLADTARIYINGELPENGNFNPMTGILQRRVEGVNERTAPLYLRGGFESFNGTLDDVAMWDRPLSPEEVRLVYESGPLSVERDEVTPIITAIELNRETKELTLTWDSTEGDTFAVLYSTDLISWDSDLDDGIAAGAGDSTTETFSLEGLALPEKVFFRVEKR
jgi:hypothetical protein